MKVAVIGSGSLGLVYIKNMKEEGLDVTGFDRWDRPGGLWLLNDDPNITCAYPCTRTNFSKHRACATDFPHLDSVPLHPTRQDMEDYHLRYAKHFDLLPHIRFHTEVVSVDFVDPEEADVDKLKYVVTYRPKEGGEEQTEVFDKVVVATGLNVRVNVPVVEGIEKFKGTALTSQSFKNGAAFKDKRVVVVGARWSASDVIEELVRNGAGKVYMSHRRGVLAVPRGFAGKALDYWFNRRGQYILDTLDSIRPYWASTMMDLMLHTISKWSFKIKPEWGFKPYPDAYSSIWTISDVIVPLLTGREIISIPVIDSIEGPHSLLLANGRTLDDIDAIIFATGYLGSLPTVLSPAVKARMAPPPMFAGECKLDERSDGSESDGFLHLYKGNMAASLPSLALYIQGFGPEGAMASTDVGSMGLAGVWSGKIAMPSEEVRWRGCLKDKAWHLGLHKHFTAVTPGHIRLTVDLYSSAKDIGCEIDTHLSWTSLSAWKWWLSSSDNRRLTSLVLDGMASPAVYRLWGRKKWDGAREMIEKANRESEWVRPVGRDAEWRAIMGMERDDDSDDMSDDEKVRWGVEVKQEEEGEKE